MFSFSIREHFKHTATVRKTQLFQTAAALLTFNRAMFFLIKREDAGNTVFCVPHAYSSASTYE